MQGIKDHIVVVDIFAYSTAGPDLIQNPMDSCPSFCRQGLSCKKIPAHLWKPFKIWNDLVKEPIQQGIKCLLGILFVEESPDGVEIGVEVRRDPYGAEH